jgi:hypothetical protein
VHIVVSPHVMFVVSHVALQQSESAVQAPPSGVHAATVPHVVVATSQMPLQHSVLAVHAAPSAAHITPDPQVPALQIALQHSES